MLEDDIFPLRKNFTCAEGVHKKVEKLNFYGKEAHSKKAEI